MQMYHITLPDGNFHNQCSITCIHPHNQVSTSIAMPNTTSPEQSTTISKIPHGFTISTAPDGQQYLVPQFMVPTLDQAFLSYQTKLDLAVSQAQSGVSDVSSSTIDSHL